MLKLNDIYGQEPQENWQQRPCYFMKENSVYSADLHMQIYGLNWSQASLGSHFIWGWAATLNYGTKDIVPNLLLGAYDSDLVYLSGRITMKTGISSYLLKSARVSLPALLILRITKLFVWGGWMGGWGAILCTVGCSAAFSNILLPTRCQWQPPSSNYDNSKCLHTLPSVPWGARPSPTENHRNRPLIYSVKFLKRPLSLSDERCLIDS